MWLNWTVALLLHATDYRLGPLIIESSLPFSLHIGQANLAWRTYVGLFMSNEHAVVRGSQPGSDGVPEVLAGKTGLVTKLLFNPERESY